MPHILVIGGGPAGLRAAEVASAAGARVTLCDQKPSVGRKFLVAGKGGLNLTHSEEIGTFATRYSGPDQPEGFWAAALAGFDNRAIRAWAEGLEVETFVQTSGRVYPKVLKAAPLLRRWVGRLREQGVEFLMNHRLRKLGDGIAIFSTLSGEVGIGADAIILAMGGGSWPYTGSDGEWVRTLAELGVAVTPLTPANCGWEVDWPEDLVGRLEGRYIKNLVVSTGRHVVHGEIMLTRYGIEGGPIYALGPVLRAMEQPAITLDLKPTFHEDRLVAKMESARQPFLDESRLRWKLSEPMRLLLGHFHGPFDSPRDLAACAKACRIPLRRPRPLAEAISSAGGVAWKALNGNLMIRNLPGVFVAGEMIDWEAPTGGYLLQGCFATGTHAAKGALRFSGLE